MPLTELLNAKGYTPRRMRVLFAVHPNDDGLNDRGEERLLNVFRTVGLTVDGAKIEGGCYSK